MKHTNVKLLTMMTSIVFMMTAGPAAFGQATSDTHNADLFFTSTDIADGVLIQWAGTNNVNPPVLVGSGLFDIIVQHIFIMYAPPNVGFGNVDTSNELTCAATTPSLAGQIKYVLYHDDGLGNGIASLTAVTSAFIDVGVNNLATVFYDSVDPTIPPAILPTNTATPAVAGDGFGSGSPATAEAGLQAGTIITPGLANAGEFYVWHKTAADGITPIVAVDDSAATAAIGDIFAVACGFLDANSVAGVNPNPINGDNTFDASNNIEASFSLKETVVGGMVLGIKTVPLLVAGASSNALWILPILGLAGMIIAIRKLEA